MENEISSIVGKIENVKVIRTGTTQREGRNIPWTLFEVIINSQVYKTFDAQYQNLIGKSGEWKYKTEIRQGKDRTFENKTLLNIPKPGIGEILTEIKELNRKVDILLGAKKPSGPVDSPDDFEPDPDEIPIVEE